MKYDVQVDVTMSMRVEVEANSKEEAERLIKEKHYLPSDLGNAWFVGNEVVEIEELEE